MIQGLASFAVREFGAALQAGYKCPICLPGRLLADPGDADRLICDECSSVFTAGWRRHHWSDSAPTHLRGTPVEKLGGFYETIQNYPAPPHLAESISDEPLSHLADFVIDIDREDLHTAAQDATKVHGFLETVCPGQTRIYFSGSKGFHLVVPWQTVGVTPTPTLNHREYRELSSLIARKTGVVPDYKIYSPARMLRIPDTRHPKTGLYKIEVAPGEIGLSPMLAFAPRGPVNTNAPAFSPEMHRLFEQAVEKAELNDKYVASPVLTQALMGGVPPCVTSLMDHGLPARGTRHAVYLMLARYWLSSGTPLTVTGGFTGSTQVGGALMMGREYAALPDPNTNTPQGERMRDMEETIRYVYRNSVKFGCSVPREIGICSDECPLRRIEDHPIGGMFMASGRMTV